MSNLPNGWVKARLSDFCEIVQGQSPPSSKYNREERGLPFFQGKTDFGSINPVARVWCDGPSKIAEQGDVLISIRAPVGPTNVADQRCAIGRGLAAIRPLDQLQTSFVLYAIRFREHELRSVSTGSTFAAISGAQLRGLAIPLPPLSEQGRIVAEIEKQCTRLDKARHLLTLQRTKLERFESAVLNSATHDLKVGPVLFRDLLASPLRNGHSAKRASDGIGIRAITLSAITEGDFSEANTKLTSADPKRVQDLWISPDDFLFQRGNTPGLV